MKTIVDEAGRIHLPDAVRAQLGVRPGDAIELEERAGEWVLRPAAGDTGLSWEGNVLVHKGATKSGVRIDEVVDEARNERYLQLAAQDVADFDLSDSLSAEEQAALPVVGFVRPEILHEPIELDFTEDRSR